MNIHKTSDYIEIAEELASKSYNAGSAGSTAVDLTKYNNSTIAYFVSLGDKGASGTLVVKVQECDDTAGTNAADVTGLTTGTLSANGTAVINVPVRKLTKRFCRVYYTAANNAVVFGVTRVTVKAKW